MDSDFPRGRAPAGGDALTTMVTATREPPVGGSDRLVGRRLEGRYEILRPLARGGMATVYVAADHRLAREVAVKVMHQGLAHDPAFVARFRREATAAASIRHPNVVSVTDTGADGDVVYLVMELIRGRTLREVIADRGRLSPEQALQVLDAVLCALAAAHARGLVHRDVKPENVLLGDDGAIAVADFGLARAIEAGSLTTGLLLGTVAYVAPEQVSRGRADARSDVYAAGIVLFELLTGRVPYEGATPVAVAYRHVHERVPAPSSVLGGIPRAVDDLVAAATAPDPAARYPDAAAFLAAVRQVRPGLAARTDGPATAGAVIPPARTPRRGGPAGAPADLLPPRPAGPPPHATRALPAPPYEPPRATAPEARRRRRWPWVLAVVLLLTAGAVFGGWALGRDARTHVPALTDRSLPAVESALAAHHLNWRVGPARHSDLVATGLVVSTEPPPGTAVKTHTTVLVSPSAGVLVLAVPTLVGHPAADAAAALAQEGFAVPKDVRAYSDTAAVGTVLATTPKGGARVDHRTVVVLTVSAGPAPVAIPDETGQSQADATRTLASLGLRAVVSQRFSSTVPAGTVISATPRSGTGHRGDTVALVVSKGPQTVVVPDLGVYDGNSAAKALRALGLVPREIALFGIHGGVVVTQRQKPGSTVVVGSTVTYYTAY